MGPDSANVSVENKQRKHITAAVQMRHRGPKLKQNRNWLKSSVDEDVRTQVFL